MSQEHHYLTTVLLWIVKGVVFSGVKGTVR